MALLGAKNLTEPQDITKQLSALREQEKRYKAAKEDYLRGRTIHQAEEDLKKLVSSAKSDAKSIREEASNIRSKAEVELKEAEKAKVDAKSKLDALSAKENGLIDRESAISAKEDEVQRLEHTLKSAISGADSRQSKYEAKLNQVETALKGLING